MEPAWHLSVEIGVGIFAICGAMVMQMWFEATVPSKRLRLGLACWLVGGSVAALPVAFFQRNAGWLVVGLFLGLVMWGSMELRRRANHWIYVDWPEKREREDASRAYKPKSFDN